MAAYGDCRRLRYWNYHYAGTGLQRTTLGLPLINGDYVHLALSRLLTGDALTDIVRELSARYTEATTRRGIAGIPAADSAFLVAEQLCLLEGMVRAWDRVRKPALLAEYAVVDVEREMPFQFAPGIVDMIRLDAVLRRKRDGMLFIKEYKTVSYVTEDWTKKFEHDSQLLNNTLAAEALYKEPIGGILIEGLPKGKRSMERSITSPFYGQVIQQSPFCYAYKVYEKTTGLPIYEHSWSRGAEKVPVWEMPGGIEKWLEEFNDVDLNAMFTVMPALKPTRLDLERWHRQMVHQETVISQDVQNADKLLREAQAYDVDEAWDAYFDYLDVAFPQNHNHCFRYFGHPCAMERLCFTSEIERDPLGSGNYEPRVPHHPTQLPAAEPGA